MPLALDPSETFPVILPRDAGKSPTPTFRFRHLTRRDRRMLEGFLRKPEADLRAMDPAAVESFVENLWTLLDSFCVGWSGMDAPPWPSSLEMVLTDAEVWPLAVEVLKGTSLTEADRKNLPSPSPSAGASSVPAAEATAADVAKWVAAGQA